MLMKTLLKVATKYKTVLMVNAFPSSFLEPLLRMSLVQDAGIRRIVQEILHTLLDRHDNSSKLRSVRYVIVRTTSQHCERCLSAGTDSFEYCET